MRTLVLALTFSLVAASVFAQPPAEACGAGDSLSGADTLPIDLTATPTTDDFTMTGTGCVEEVDEHVTCFTPTSGCTVDATCSDPAARGISISINAFDGGCTPSPAVCLASNPGGSSATITGLVLTGGETYCFVCESTSPVPVRLEVVATAGDCGALPVALQGFAVD